MSIEKSSQEILTVNLNSETSLSDPNNPLLNPRSRNKTLAIASKYLFLSLLAAHFSWATYYFVESSDAAFSSTTCTGYGFLTIIYAITVAAVLYNKLFKRFLNPSLEKHIYTPLVSTVARIRYANVAFYLAVLVASLGYLIWDTTGNRQRLVPISGIGVFLVMGYLLSKHRKEIPWRTVIWGIILQFTMGLLVIRWEPGRNVFQCIGDKATTFLNYAQQGAIFVYGDELVTNLKVFAFQALCTIFFLGFIVNVLYHYGIMQRFVLGLGLFLSSIMGTSICESVNSAANIFLGQSEAPLLLKPYLQDLTASEIHCVLLSGFATVAGTVLAAYISFGASATHLITASVMSAPAALCYSKLLYPETEEVKTEENIKLVKSHFESGLDAGSKGAWDALQLVQGIVASVIAFVSVVAFGNGVLGFFGETVGFSGENTWTVELILGKIFIPVSYLMGVPWEECESVGYLVGIKTIVNEFVAFSEMQNMQLTPRTKVIATYALCGFSNPCSVGIMISALSILIPDKRTVVTRVMYRAFFGGSIVCFMTASFAALLIPDDLVDI